MSIIVSWDLRHPSRYPLITLGPAMPARPEYSLRYNDDTIRTAIVNATTDVRAQRSAIFIALNPSRLPGREGD